MDQFRAKVLLEQKRNQLHLESFMRHDNIQKSQPEDINPFDKFEEDIQKGKPAAIGETRVWNGKKMRKQANGKWVEVSEQGKTYKEHKEEADKLQDEWLKLDRQGGAYRKSKELKEKHSPHYDQVIKLSDKEYTDEEVEGGEDDDIKVGSIVLSFDTNKITLFKELQKEPDKYRDVIQYMESKGENWDKINMIKVGRMVLDAQK